MTDDGSTRHREPVEFMRSTQNPRFVLCLIWVVAILVFTLAAVLVRSAEAAEPAALTFESPATVSVTGPLGRCSCVSVTVHWRLDAQGVHAQMTVPGPIAGRPWTCRTGRTWESLAAELLNGAARYATPYVERLGDWLAEREVVP